MDHDMTKLQRMLPLLVAVGFFALYSFPQTGALSTNMENIWDPSFPSPMSPFQRFTIAPAFNHNIPMQYPTHHGNRKSLHLHVISKFKRLQRNMCHLGLRFYCNKDIGDLKLIHEKHIYYPVFVGASTHPQDGGEKSHWMPTPQSNPSYSSPSYRSPSYSSPSYSSPSYSSPSYSSPSYSSPSYSSPSYSSPSYSSPSYSSPSYSSPSYSSPSSVEHDERMSSLHPTPVATPIHHQDMSQVTSNPQSRFGYLTHSFQQSEKFRKVSGFVPRGGRDVFNRSHFANHDERFSIGPKQGERTSLGVSSYWKTKSVSGVSNEPQHDNQRWVAVNNHPYPIVTEQKGIITTSDGN